jgi:hypothetical protein
VHQVCKIGQPRARIQRAKRLKNNGFVTAPAARLRAAAAGGSGHRIRRGDSMPSLSAATAWNVVEFWRRQGAVFERVGAVKACG